MKEICDFLRQYQSYAVLTHVNPDGDALGSAYAMTLLLRAMGKQAVTLLMAEPPKRYAFERFEAVQTHLPTGMTFDAVVAVDCATRERLGAYKELFFSLPNVNIDHHLTNDQYGKINCVQDAPSTGEIVESLYDALQIEPPETARMALYMAMATDTGNFTYSNTTANTFRKAARMVELGFPLTQMSEQIFNSRTLEGTKLIARFINHIRLYEEGQFAVSYILLKDLEETGAVLEDCETLVNYAREIQGVRIAAFVREMKQNTYKISLRANGEHYVDELASRFGGGGHRKAAGFKLEEEFHEVMDILLRSVKDYL